MAEIQYVFPPEYHVFERGAKYLLIDPRNFIWFVTDSNGKAAIDGLAKAGRPEDAAESLASALGMSASESAVTEYISKYTQHLLDIGFLHDGEYKKEPWWGGILERPRTIYMHLTSKCNLKCPYCYNQEHRTELIGLGRGSKSKEITTEGKLEGFLRIIDEAGELGFKEVKLTGGEALINKDALQIAERAKSYGMRVNLLTNGLLVTEEMAQKIAHVVDSVSISLDSKDPEEHDSVRGKGSHAKVLKAIERLKRAGVKHLHLNAVITPVNVNSVGTFLDYGWNELKADQVTVAGAAIDVEDPTGRWQAAEYELSGEQYRQVYEQSKQFYQIQGRSQAQIVPRAALWRRHCGVGNGIISMDPNGDIYPCQTLHRPEFLCGNALQSGLRNVLETSGIIKKMKRIVVDILPECNVCPVRYVCSGGCRAEAYTREGSLLERNRAMCPTFFETAVDQLWDAATIPVQNLDQAVENYHAHSSCH